LVGSLFYQPWSPWLTSNLARGAEGMSSKFQNLMV
jgi:hypothetical protein